MSIRFILSVFAALYLAVTPMQSAAQDVAADFAQMPRNLKMEFSNNKGDTWAQIYRGKKRGMYVVDSFRGNGSLRFTAYFGLDGHLGRREYTNGNVRTFTPHHCGRVMGNCAYGYNNTQGNSGSGTAKLTKKGKTYTYSWKIDGKTRKGRFTLGQFNIATSGRAADGVKWKLERMTVAN